MRSEQAAADSIQRTVEGGATLQDGFRTAAVGSQTVFANSLNDQAVSDNVMMGHKSVWADVCGLDAVCNAGIQ